MMRPVRLAAVPLFAVLGCGSATDDRPARLSYIQPAILRPSCATASCHSAGVAVGGVRLDSIDEAEESLLPAKDDPATDGNEERKDPLFFVVPGDPLRSSLLHLLRADGTRRMPRDAPLPEPDIALIERWILEGAPR